MKICGVIPIRLDSTRFPGKGLALLQGKEIILHVYDRAREYQRFSRLIVATDDLTIKRLIQERGGQVFFSDQRFRNGSERVAAAVADCDCDVCINIQGDEVFVSPEMLEQTVQILEGKPDVQVATLAFPIADRKLLEDRNLVKVRLDGDGMAGGFSRLPYTDIAPEENYGHIGIYAFRKPFLTTYASWEPTEDELSESLEQLRILGHGYMIGVAVSAKPALAINTASDLATAEELLLKKGG